MPPSSRWICSSCVSQRHCQAPLPRPQVQPVIMQPASSASVPLFTATADTAQHTQGLAAKETLKALEEQAFALRPASFIGKSGVKFVLADLEHRSFLQPPENSSQPSFLRVFTRGSDIPIPDIDTLPLSDALRILPGAIGKGQTQKIANALQLSQTGKVSLDSPEDATPRRVTCVLF